MSRSAPQHLAKLPAVEPCDDGASTTSPAAAGCDMDSLDDLGEELAITIGRVNALHAVLLTIARYLPPEVAGQTHDRLLKSSEAAIAGVLATPVPEVTLDEMQRVLHDFVAVLAMARNQK